MKAGANYDDRFLNFYQDFNCHTLPDGVCAEWKFSGVFRPVFARFLDGGFLPKNFFSLFVIFLVLFLEMGSFCLEKRVKRKNWELK